MSAVSCQNMTTVQLADHEWSEAYRNFVVARENSTAFQFPYPPPLELLRFLDQSISSPSSTDYLKQSTGTSLLVSYPRSGNTLLRTLIERTTGIVTGSDTRPDRSLSKELAESHNLVGEGLVYRSKTCFVKTHWPERVGCQIFEGHRAILIVRNPFDAIDSYWNLNVTNTHTETVTDEIYERFRDKFEQLAKNEINVWCDYHRYWLKMSRSEKFPLLIIRFEDLIQQPNVEIARILRFMALINNTSNGQGQQDQPLHPFWEQRIAHATTTTGQHTSLGSYRPRTATRGVKSIGKSLHKERYTSEVLDHVHSIAAEKAEADGGENMLTLFGYNINEQSFPANFVNGSAPDKVEWECTLPSCTSGETSMMINNGELIRPQSCPFGRAMRSWRRQHTNNDQDPFPRVPR